MLRGFRFGGEWWILLRLPLPGAAAHGTCPPAHPLLDLVLNPSRVFLQPASTEAYHRARSRHNRFRLAWPFDFDRLGVQYRQASRGSHATDRPLVALAKAQAHANARPALPNGASRKGVRRSTRAPKAALACFSAHHGAWRSRLERNARRRSTSGTGRPHQRGTSFPTRPSRPNEGSPPPHPVRGGGGACREGRGTAFPAHSGSLAPPGFPRRTGLGPSGRRMRSPLPARHSRGRSVPDQFRGASVSRLAPFPSR